MDIFDSEADALAFAGVSHSETSALPNREKPATIDTSRWAQPVPALTIKTRIKGARNLNIEGRRAVGPVNGFGQLWQKIFRLTIQGPMITPGEAVVALKQNFPSFQPSFNRFYPSPAGIKPGEIILIDSMTPGGPVSTGVLVLYADEQSFTFACPEGHPESGFVTFSGHEENGNTIVQILGLARANDPVYEAAFRFVGSKVQGRIWTHVLKSLAAYLGVPGQISLAAACIDAGFQWSQAKNLKYNAQIRTLIKEPLFMLTKLFGDHNKKETRPA
jgi:hypothetical protein